MRIEMYSASDRSLYIHDDDISQWINDPWIRYRGDRLSLRDLTDDPGIDRVVGLVFYSTADPTTPQAPVVIQDRWLFYDVGKSADRFLDEYTADALFEGSEEWVRIPLRAFDQIGLITGLSTGSCSST